MSDSLYNVYDAISLYPYQTDKYSMYKTPDPILLLSDTLDPKFTGFVYDENDFFDFNHNIYGYGSMNTIIFLFIICLIILIMYDFLVSIK